MAKTIKKSTAAVAVALGAIAYIMAVTQRSTMGVASLSATERFHTNAEQLSMLAVAQLITYAAMQVPVGLLLDRFGPRRLIFTGTLLISSGQYLVAFATQLPLAVAGRMTVGVGDAFVFISMIRLINVWYSGSRASQLQQWLGNAGQLGQVVSAFPFAIMLHVTSWNFAFATWATIGLLVALGVWVLAIDEMAGQPAAHHVHIKTRLQHLRSDVKRPSTRTAFWVHFSTNPPATVVLLLWGVPFLEQGQHLRHFDAMTLLSSFVVFGLPFGLLYGWICARRPGLRTLALGLGNATVVTAWALVLLWPGVAPMPLLVTWVVVTSAVSASCMIAFDYTRQYAPKRQLGSINGYVNIGGFLASFSMMFAIGLVLDVFYELVGKAAGYELYSLEGFKIALWVVPIVIIGGHWRYRVNERRISAEISASE